MRKVILYIAVSLDNFIAKPDGDISWLQTPDLALEGEDFGYVEFYDSIDTTIMGNKTYQQILGFDIPFPYSEKTNYVFSRTLPSQNHEHASIVNGNVVDFVKKLKAKEGKDIWLIGGGDINTLLLDNKLIDKIILTIVPVTLGEGIPVYERGEKELEFDMEKSTSFKNGMVQLVLNAI